MIYKMAAEPKGTLVKLTTFHPRSVRRSLANSIQNFVEKGRSTAYNLERLKNILEELEDIKNDKKKESRVKALMTDMQKVRAENLKLTEEKKAYSETITTLENILTEKESVLNIQTSKLKTKLSVIDRQKYEEISKSGKIKKQVQYLKAVNSELSNNIIEILVEKQSLLQDLEEVKILFTEAEKRLEKCNLLEARYKVLCEEVSQERNPSTTLEASCC